MHRHAFAITCILALLPLLAMRGSAQDPTREYEIKSVYLYHFCRFVEWPMNAVPGDDKMFVIGVYGSHVFEKHVERLMAQTVNEKKLVVHHFAAAQDVKPCHILFIAPGNDADKRLAHGLKLAKDGPYLLVSNTEGFARKGVVFNFFIEENAVKFEINPEAAKRAKVKLNPQLLRLPQVKIVKDGPGGN